MKANSKLISLILVCTVIVSACRKYDEGPWLILQSKSKRLVGTWELEYLVIDGTDYAHNYKDDCAPQLSIKLASETKKFGYVSFGPSKNLAGCRPGTGGDWYFGSHKKELILQFNPVNGSYEPTGPFLSGEYLAWTITKLTDDQLWLKIDYKNQHTWVHFKKT